MSDARFEEWWARRGRLLDPDTSDVPLKDKLRELMLYAWTDGYREGLEEAAKEIALLKREVKAYRDLCTAYRLGGSRPPERALDELDKIAKIRAAAKGEEG